jgi:hypothetical protein
MPQAVSSLNHAHPYILYTQRMYLDKHRVTRNHRASHGEAAFDGEWVDQSIHGNLPPFFPDRQVDRQQTTPGT